MISLLLIPLISNGYLSAEYMWIYLEDFINKTIDKRLLSRD